MRLLRVGPAGMERPCVRRADGTVVDVSGLVADFGPDDDVLIPRGSLTTDWQVERAVVLGAEGRYLADEQAALDTVAGYAVAKDVSERHFQLERGGQWVKGKSCETFNPLGPWLVTADEVPDPQPLSMSLSGTGERRQTGNTSTGMTRPVYLQDGDGMTLQIERLGRQRRVVRQA